MLIIIGISGTGRSLWKRSVWVSTTSMRVTGRIYWPKLAGLPGTLGARPMVKTTSSAVKGVPSWKVTPGRSLISHVVGATGCQLSAKPGEGRPLLSLITSGSKIWLVSAVLGERSWKCGSMAVKAPPVAMVSAGWAVAVPAMASAERMMRMFML